MSGSSWYPGEKGVEGLCMPTSQIRARVSGKYLSAGDGEASLAGRMGAGDTFLPSCKADSKKVPSGCLQVSRETQALGPGHEQGSRQVGDRQLAPTEYGGAEEGQRRTRGSETHSRVYALKIKLHSVRQAN